MGNNIHSSAIVDPGTKIGNNVQIGPNSVVEKNVEISDNTRIDSCVKIGSGTRIGKECHIFHGAVVGEIPQDLKFHGEDSISTIGDRTQIREFVTIHRGTEKRGKTDVGSDCLLMAYSHVAHDCSIQDHVVLANMVQLGGHCIIDEWAYIGGMTGVHQFSHIGKHSFIGGGFRCIQDIPPFIMGAGDPLKFSGLNLVGLRRRGFSNETINQLKEAYRLIFRSEFNVSQALEQIQSAFEPTTELNDIIHFIQKSERGIIS